MRPRQALKGASNTLFKKALAATALGGSGRDANQIGA